MPRLISRADLARRAGCSRAAVTQACSRNLADACHGDRVDLDADSVRAFLADNGAADGPTGSRKGKPGRPRKPMPEEPPRLDEVGFSEELGDYTLHEIVQKFGTIRSYRDLLEANEKRERALKNHLDNEQRRGQLIDRELVEKHCVGLIDAMSKQLLSDAAKTITARAYAMAKAGAPLEDGERVAREIMSSHLKPTKRKTVRVLREAAQWTDG